MKHFHANLPDGLEHHAAGMAGSSGTEFYGQRGV